MSIDDVLQAGRPAVFFDGHAMDRFSQATANPADLAHYDWPVIDGNKFGNADPDRKRGKQAEMLVHKFAPWSSVVGIGVLNDAMKTRVGQILAGYPTSVHKPIAVQPAWYF